MPDYRLTITLTEPFTCSSHPVISNEIHTLDFIPATVLRGALAATLSYLGRAADLPRWFGTSGPKYTSALPIPDSGGTLIPMPFCFAADKKDTPFNGRFHTLNTHLVKVPDTAAEYSALTGHDLTEHHQFQWTGVRKPWLRVVDGVPVEACSLDLDSSMHVGLHYGRQSAREGALFSRREIPAGTSFEAWVSNLPGEPADIPDFLFLGKRRSAGNGSASLNAELATLPWTVPPTLTPARFEVSIQLMADALVPDPATGSWLRGLDDAFWKRALSLTDVSVIASASTNRPILGWSTRWDLPRSQALAIGAGSVYRLRCAANPAALSASLKRLAADGIGIRRHEGFGVIAVDPPWLQAPVNGVVDLDPRPPSITTRPQSWPGLESQDAAKIVRLARDAQTVAARLKATVATQLGALSAYSARVQATAREALVQLQQQLGALSAYSARVQQPADVLAFARSFAARPNPRSWAVLFREVEEIIGQTADITQTRFVLAAIETYMLKDG